MGVSTVAGRRIVCGAITGLLLAAGAGSMPARAQAPAPAARVFGSDAGLVLNFIKADKAADFEIVVEKLKAVLRKSTKPERRQQAAGWKVFKSAEAAAAGSVLYVFVMDPVVKGADYTVSTVLAEGLAAAEVTELYKKYAEAYSAGQNIVDMALVSDFSKPGTPWQDHSPRTSGSVPRRRDGQVRSARRFPSGRPGSRRAA